MITKRVAVCNPRLIAEGWVDLEELEGLGAVEVLEVHPLPGEVVFVPTRSGWALLRVEEGRGALAGPTAKGGGGRW
jgi:hypothetical protein